MHLLMPRYSWHQFRILFNFLVLSFSDYISRNNLNPNQCEETTVSHSQLRSFPLPSLPFSLEPELRSTRFLVVFLCQWAGFFWFTLSVVLCCDPSLRSPTYVGPRSCLLSPRGCQQPLGTKIGKGFQSRCCFSILPGSLVPASFWFRKISLTC